MDAADDRDSPGARKSRRGFTVYVMQRVLLAVVGGYFLTSGLVSTGAVILAAIMPSSDTVVLMAMLGFVIYLALLLWGFTERRLTRLWLVLGGGAVLVQIGLSLAAS